MYTYHLFLHFTRKLRTLQPNASNPSRERRRADRYPDNPPRVESYFFRKLYRAPPLDTCNQRIIGDVISRPDDPPRATFGEPNISLARIPQIKTRRASSRLLHRYTAEKSAWPRRRPAAAAMSVNPDHDRYHARHFPSPSFSFFLPLFLSIRATLGVPRSPVSRSRPRRPASLRACPARGRPYYRIPVPENACLSRLKGDGARYWRNPRRESRPARRERALSIRNQFRDNQRNQRRAQGRGKS